MLLQFLFFLNFVIYLLRTNSPRRNGRSCAGPSTLFNFRRNGNRQIILIKHSTYIHACCHQRYSLDRDRMHIFAVYGCRRSGIDNEVFPYRVLRKLVCVLSNEVNPFLPILFDLVWFSVKKKKLARLQILFFASEGHMPDCITISNQTRMWFIVTELIYLCYYCH